MGYDSYSRVHWQRDTSEQDTTNNNSRTRIYVMNSFHLCHLIKLKFHICIQHFKWKWQTKDVFPLFSWWWWGGSRCCDGVLPLLNVQYMLRVQPKAGTGYCTSQDINLKDICAQNLIEFDWAQQRLFLIGWGRVTRGRKAFNHREHWISVNCNSIHDTFHRQIHLSPAIKSINR